MARMLAAGLGLLLLSSADAFIGTPGLLLSGRIAGGAASNPLLRARFQKGRAGCTSLQAVAGDWTELKDEASGNGAPVWGREVVFAVQH